MNRRTALILLLLCGAATAVGLVAWSAIRDDRHRLVREFADDKRRLVDEAARAVSASLEEVAQDLRYVSRLVAGTPGAQLPERELQALLTVVKPYKLAVVLDDAGRKVAEVQDPAVTPELRRAFERSLVDLFPRAAAAELGRIEVSPPLGSPSSGFVRLFATPIPPREDGQGGVFVLLVDTEPFFGMLRLLASEPSSRLLLLGAHGRPIPVSDPRLAEHAAHAGPRANAEFGHLVARMRQGERGLLQLGPSSSEALGIGQSDTVAAFAPIEVEGGSNWTVAILTSTAQLRALERAVILRLGVAALLVALSLVAFGGWLVVSSRRSAQLAERLRSADALAHLHEKTQKILDNIPTGVAALSLDGRITALNDALRRRVSPGETPLERLAGLFQGAPPALVSRIEALVKAALDTGKVQTLRGEPVPLFGEEGQFTVVAVPLEPRDPEVRVLLVVEDLSHLRALESQLLRTEKLATVGVLAAGIAHEVGTPLGVVRGRAEYVLGKLGQEHPQASGVQVIIEQIDRVSRTIRQLLDFSRLQPAAAHATSLTPVTRAVAELLKFELEKRKVALALDVPEDLAPLLADPDQLQQVLVNLTLNSAAACQPGGRVHISASPEIAEAPSQRVRITVEDDGCGIPAQNLHQVFDPFFTTKKRGQGTGLGLAVVAQIVRNHGGQVEIESEDGKGTRVIVHWPVTTERGEVKHVV